MINLTVASRLRWGHPLRTAADLCRMARAEGASTVSLDLFDTLVFRTLSKPSDLFSWQGQKLEAAGFLAGSETDWPKARKEVEEALAAEARPAEVTLEEIYDRLLEKGHLTNRQARDAAILEELRLEAECIVAHPGSQNLLASLRAEGFRVVVSTDTYLPADFIRRVLQKLDLMPDDLFVSSATMTTKRHGTMYEQLKRKYLGLVHAGDNPRVDQTAARLRGVKGSWFLWPYYSELKKFAGELSYLQRIGQSHVPSSFAGRTASPLADLGIRWAVVLYDYLRAMRAHAQANGVTDVWLLSRDGESLNEALTSAPEFLQNFNVEYVRASRKFTHSVTAAREPRRFALWNKREPSSEEKTLGYVVERYYRSKLTSSSTHVMIVDMTGKGRLEASIRSALPRGIRVSGFYFSLDFGHEAGQDFGQFIPRKYTAFHQAAVETLSGFTEGTCIGAIEVDGVVEPVLEKNALDVAPAEYVAALRSTLASLCGVDNFVVDGNGDALASFRRKYVKMLQMYPSAEVEEAMSAWPFVDSFGASPTLMTRPPVSFSSRLLARKSSLNVWPSLGIYSAVPKRLAPIFMSISQLRLAARDLRTRR